MADLNPFDFIVGATVLLSALLAFVRGFTREFLSFFAWAGAGVAAYFAFPYLQPFAQQQVQGKVYADALAIGGGFFLALLVLTIIGHQLSGKVKDSRLSSIDRSLGFAFGLVRGAVIVSLAWLFITWLYPTEAERPDWVRTAKLQSLLAHGGQFLRDQIPDPRVDERSREAERLRVREERTRLEDAALERLANPTPQVGRPAAEGTAPVPVPGYSDQERSRLEQLIETSDPPVPGRPASAPPPSADRKQP
jgi:membrane protein required for colicin V production